MKNWNPVSLSALRLFLVLLLPLNAEAHYTSGEMGYSSYNCVLSRFILSQNYYYGPEYIIETTMLPFLLLGLVVLVSAPLMAFEFELSGMPLEKSIQSFAFGTIFLSTFFSIYLSNFLSDFTPYYWMMPDVILAFTWSCVLFFVIPIIVRESKQLEYHLKKRAFVPPPKRRRPSNYTILGYILGIIVSFIPYSFFVFDSTRGYNIAIVSNSFVVNQIARGSPIFENNIMYYTQNYASNLSSSSLFIAHICFCIYILRYFKGKATRKTVYAIGLFVAFFPSIYNAIGFLFFMGAVNIPLPFLLFTGFILMKVIPLAKQEDSVWDDRPQQKWFEDSRVMEEEGLAIVKVPLRYLLLSKLRGLSPKVKSSQIKLEAEKIDDEEVWSD